MTSMTAFAPAFAPDPSPDPIDITPILLTAHLLGLVVVAATILGLVPVAIALVRAMI